MNREIIARLLKCLTITTKELFNNNIPISTDDKEFILETISIVNELNEIEDNE